MATGRFRSDDQKRRLIVDGKDGRIAILNGASRAAFDDPAANMGFVLFHSELDYLRVEQQLSSTVTFPYRGAPSKEVGKKKDKYRVPVRSEGEALYSLGTVAGEINAPLAAFTAGGEMIGATSLLEEVNERVVSSGSGEQSYRTLSTYISDAGEIIVRESYLIFGRPLPEVSIDLRIVKFAELTGPDPALPYTLRITPLEVIASQGKLNSNYRYVRKVGGEAPFRFVYGRTLDVRGGDLVFLTPPSVGAEI